MYSSNIFNVLCVAKILNLARKIANETSCENITTKINCNEKKKSIKTTFNIQKIIQRDNVSNYY